MSTQHVASDSISDGSATEESGSLVFLAVLSVAALVAYLPTLFMHFDVLWRSEQYQYFPFVIGAVAWLGWNRWQEASLIERAEPLNWKQKLFHHQLPILGVLMSIAIFAVAVYCQWGWLTAVSLNLLVGSGLLVLTKYFHVRNAWGIWGLLWLMVPPPIEFGANVVQRMQLVSSSLGSMTLDLFRIDHLMAGNVFTLPTKQLFVDEACSGIVSVMSVIAATGIYAVWKDRSLLHAGLLMLSSVCWALVMNTVRLVIIAVAEHSIQLNLSEGSPHEILGLVLFMFTFVASMSTDQLLDFVLSPVAAPPGESDAKRNVLIRIWNRLSDSLSPKYIEPNAEPSRLNQMLAGILIPKALVSVVPVALIGIWSALIAFGAIGGKPESKVDALNLAQSIGEDTLPANPGSWTLVNYEMSDRTGENVLGNYDFGQFSNSYRYENKKHQANVAMDYPFSGGWHELSACYRSRGWTIVERNALNQNGREFVETNFEIPDKNEYGYLLFNNFNERGQVFTPPSGAILLRSWLFVRRRFLRKVAGDLYQTQLFISSKTPLTDQEKAEAKELFLTAEGALTSHIGTLSK